MLKNAYLGARIGFDTAAASLFPFGGNLRYLQTLKTMRCRSPDTQAFRVFSPMRQLQPAEDNAAFTSLRFASLPQTSSLRFGRSPCTDTPGLGADFQVKIFVLAFCCGGELKYQNIVKISKSLWASRYQSNGSIDIDFCVKSAILRHLSRSTRKCNLSHLHISDFAKIFAPKFQNTKIFGHILPFWPYILICYRF